MIPSRGKRKKKSFHLLIDYTRIKSRIEIADHVMRVKGSKPRVLNLYLKNNLSLNL